MLRLARSGSILALVTLLDVVGPSEALAQSTASISGVVKDTAGAVMPGVSVTVKNDASGAAQDALTDGEGRYQVSALPAGTYTVTATLTGFKTAEVKTVRLAIGQPLAVPLSLEIGSLEETITVLSSSELINTETATVAATLTPQHLMLNRGSMFRGGLRPHLYCLPVLKRERDREALLEAATSADPRFFLGTDSAPHAQGAKESSCGCAGIYSAPVAIELYAHAFEQAGRLERLESFASLRGADFYGLPHNRGTLTLERRAWPVPATLPFGPAVIVPMCAGEMLEWRIAGQTAR